MAKLIGIIGDKGDGKTMLMTKMLHDDYLAGYTIIANYKLNFPYKHMSYKEIIEAFENEDPVLNNASIGLDELLIGADSRNPGAKANKDLSYLVVQMRKRELDIYYTVQEFRFIDTRLRSQSDLLIKMSCIDTTNKQYPTFKRQVLDPKLLIFEGEPFIFKPTQSLYDLYDTKQIITKG